MSLDKSISEGRKRWILSMRTTNDGRERIKEAAEANGRSLSEEIENRLERSFQNDDRAGGFANAAFVDLIGATIRDVEADTGLSWRSDQRTWQIAREMIVAQIDQRSPDKRPTGAEPSTTPARSKGPKKVTAKALPSKKSDVA